MTPTRLLRLACRVLGHNVDAITGTCHLCGEHVLPPITKETR